MTYWPEVDQSNDVNVHKSGKMSFNTNELVLEQGHVY